MAKLNQGKIEKSDIEEYVSNHSDFSFELKILNKLVSIGFDCEHSGVYEDPIMSKTREFDITARKSLDYRNIKLSVGCKNIRDNFPLVVHCTKRTSKESFHDLIVTNFEKPMTHLAIKKSSVRVRLSYPESIYLENDYVGKSIDQVGKTSNGIVSNDSSVFEKISQAIHSAYDLIEEAHYESNKEDKITIIIPVLVIPDEMLWAVKYDDNGKQIGDVESVDQISMFIGKPWRVGYFSENEPLRSNFVWYECNHRSRLIPKSTGSIGATSNG